MSAYWPPPQAALPFVGQEADCEIMWAGMAHGSAPIPSL